tara:strand:+ start:1213 stop:1605 length:393 start_codon:yes stop_codon:yes gene_type:complete
MTEKNTLTPLEIEQKKQSHRLRKVTLLWLSKVYPAAFNMADPKPLKRQIEQDILDRVKGKKDVPSNRLIRRAVAYYTNNKAYHEAILRETHRINLEGEQIEALEERHKDFSKKRLEEIKELLKNRRHPDN